VDAGNGIAFWRVSVYGVTPMAATIWIALGVGLALVAYGSVLVGLAAAGRSIDARALAAGVASCVVLLRRLVTDARIPRRHRAALLLAVAYLMFPVDLVPDFLPVVGYLDDVLVVVLAVRLVLRRAGPELIRAHWNGSERILSTLLRLSSVSLRPASGALAWAATSGLLGLAVCVWFDIADNCQVCREDDPLLLITGRGVAAALAAAGTLGLMLRVFSPRRRDR
jgi:uncharacterized membrane protein YkvA (DUF1232 family)